MDNIRYCTRTRYKGAPAYVLEQDRLRVTILRRGAKLASIQFDGKEYLWQGGGTAYRFSEYGDVFETGEFSGFDDMFPNISACFYPEGVWAGTPLPDHGEVWTQDWQWVQTPQGVELSVNGVKLPYRLTKCVHLDDDALFLDYTVKNLCAYSLKYIWAAHPLFALETGMELTIAGCTTIANACAADLTLGQVGQQHPWPICCSGRDMRKLDPAYRGFHKYYVWNTLPENRITLVYPNGMELSLHAPVERVPYVGIWIDEGGYGSYGMRCVAPEPCTGAFDRLDTAATMNRVVMLPGHGSAAWRLTIAFQQTRRKKH